MTTQTEPVTATASIATSAKDGTAPTSYEWDAAGNRTKAGATTATFDARDRPLTEGSC
ncbi:MULTISPECIES: hypothetical protein [unclassified Streptomyces]|uniref:hypothetical protein n=1 Tax=unclassified Streptomyces TaxID=2593676 RepID=UPI000A811A12|nr:MULTISPECIES: hypothetical protein [unclassified Streptomyces]